MTNWCQKFIQLIAVICVVLNSAHAMAGAPECRGFYDGGIDVTLDTTDLGSGVPPQPPRGGSDSTRQPDIRYNYNDLLGSRVREILIKDNLSPEIFRKGFERMGVDKITNLNFLNLGTEGLRGARNFILEKNLGDYSFLIDGMESAITSVTRDATAGSQLNHVGFRQESIPAGKDDPILVLGEGFTGTIANELMDGHGYKNVKSMDTAYSKAAVDRWNKAHPEEMIALGPNDIRGDARTLKNVPNDSQVLVLGKDLLSAVAAKDVSKVINSVARVITTQGEGRLSYSGAELQGHLQLLVQAMSHSSYKGTTKLELVQEEGSTSSGYLRIRKVTSSGKAGENTGDTPSLSSVALEYIKTFQTVEAAAKAKTHFFDLSRKAVEMTPEATKLFEEFLQKFIIPLNPKITQDLPSMRILADFFMGKIYLPLKNGNLAEAANNLKLVDSSRKVQKAFVIIKGRVQELNILSDTGGLSFEAAMTAVKDKGSSLSCTIQGCATTVQGLVSSVQDKYINVNQVNSILGGVNGIADKFKWLKRE